MLFIHKTEAPEFLNNIKMSEYEEKQQTSNNVKMFVVIICISEEEAEGYSVCGECERTR